MKHEETQLKLAQALKELMEHRSFVQIHVKDIVDKAHLTRQTFYRYFKDKYDCVNWYFERVAQNSFKMLEKGMDLEEGLIRKFKLLKAEQRFFYEAFMADDQNCLFQYDYECIYQFYKNILIQKIGFLSDEMDFILKMYCKGSIDMTFEWVKNGMKMEEAEFAKRLILAMPSVLQPYLLTFNETSDK